MNVPRAYSSAGFSKRRFSGALNDAVIRVYDAVGNVIETISTLAI
jgi:hypothetical protein